MRIILTTLLLFTLYKLNGQTIDKTFYDESWSLKVKQIDDFVDRFNNELNYIDKGVIVKNQLSPDARRKLITALIDKDKVKDMEIVDKLLSTIDSTGYLIEIGATEIKSILTLSSLYKGKAFDFDFHLEIEKLDDGAMKWVIVDSNAENYPWEGIEQNPKKFINPSNHNLRFSSLNKFINDGNDIQGIFNQEFKLDNFSILIHEIIQGNLIVNRIQDLEYRIKLLDQFELQVDYVESNSKISGWLISNISYSKN